MKQNRRYAVLWAMFLYVFMEPSSLFALENQQTDAQEFGQLCGEWGENGRIRREVSGGLPGLLSRLQRFADTYPSSRFADDAAYLRIQYEVGLREPERKRVENLEAWLRQYPSIQIEDPSTSCFHAIRQHLVLSPGFWVKSELVLAAMLTHDLERGSRHGLEILEGYGRHFSSSTDESFKRMLQSVAVQTLAALHEQGKQDDVLALEPRVSGWFDSIDALRTSVTKARERLTQETR